MAAVLVAAGVEDAFGVARALFLEEFDASILQIAALDDVQEYGIVDEATLQRIQKCLLSPEPAQASSNGATVAAAAADAQTAASAQPPVPSASSSSPPSSSSLSPPSLEQCADEEPGRVPETLAELLKVLGLEAAMGGLLAAVRVGSIQDLNTDDPKAMLDPLIRSSNSNSSGSGSGSGVGSSTKTARCCKRLARWMEEHSHLYEQSTWVTNERSSPAERMAKALERLKQKDVVVFGAAAGGGDDDGGAAEDDCNHDDEEDDEHEDENEDEDEAPAEAAASSDHPGLRLWRSEPRESLDVENPPEALCCPITLELFRVPVRAADGAVYERDVIVEYMKLRSRAVEEYKRKLAEITLGSGGGGGGGGGGEKAQQEQKDVFVLKEKIKDGIESPLGQGSLRSLALRPARDVMREVIAWKQALNVL